MRSSLCVDFGAPRAPFVRILQNIPRNLAFISGSRKTKGQDLKYAPLPRCLTPSSGARGDETFFGTWTRGSIFERLQALR
jgi:hypothetical protein